MTTLPNILSILLAMAVTAYFGCAVIFALIISAIGGFGISPNSVADGRGGLVAAGFFVVPTLAAMAFVYLGLLSPSRITKTKISTAIAASAIFIGYGIFAFRFDGHFVDLAMPCLMAVTVIAYWVELAINKEEVEQPMDANLPSAHQPPRKAIH